MAYYLQFDGVDDYVSLASKIFIDGASQYRLEIDFWWDVGGADFEMISANNNNRPQFNFSETGRGFFRLDDPGSIVPTSLTREEFTTFIYDISPTTTTLTLPSGSVSAPRGVEDYGFNQIGTNRSTTSEMFKGRLYGLRVYRDGALVHNYDPSASNGTGQILPDTVGSNDGTLVNFPADNSQWVFYSDATGVAADVTESSTDFSESSNLSLTVNITAQVTELLSDFSESSLASFTANISVQVTEVSASFTESSSATITNNIVSVSVTETSQDFSESASASISGSLSAIVTELSQSFIESSTLSISANISAAVTEIAQDFADNIGVNVVGSFTLEVTETATDFDEACYLQLPVQRLVARKTISVGARSGKISVNSKRSGTIRVTRRNHIIRVK